MTNSKAPLVGRLGESVERSRKTVFDHEMNYCNEHIDSLKAALRKAEAERDEAVHYIARNGHRRCDIPACNCGSWHGWHASERLRELSDVLGDRTQGVTILGAVEKLIEENATERAARESAEKLAVWAVRNGVMVGHDECMRPCIWFDVHRGVEYDGTDAGILAVLRRALEGEK